jgi:hypothetical protein
MDANAKISILEQRIANLAAELKEYKAAAWDRYMVLTLLFGTAYAELAPAGVDIASLNSEELDDLL